MDYEKIINNKYSNCGTNFYFWLYRGEKAIDTKTPTDSQINQKSDIKTSNNPKSDIQTPDLIIKQGDVPELTLIRYTYYAFPNKSSFDLTLIPQSTYHMLYDNIAIPEFGLYDDNLKIGYRNVGQFSQWGDNVGRGYSVRLFNFDTNSNFEEYFNNGVLNHYVCDSKKDKIIGEYSLYCVMENPNTMVSTMILEFAYKNSIAFITDESNKAYDETIRIAKIIKVRLD